MSSLLHDGVPDDASVSDAAAPSRWPWWLRAFHVFVIVNFAAQMAYAGFQVFVAMQPAGVSGPMFLAAAQLPFEQMVVRRMYALEGWVAFSGLAIYIALTEILPRALAAARR